MRIKISNIKILFLNIAIIIALVIVHNITSILGFVVTDNPYGFYHFNMGYEVSLPTWYSQTILFIASSISFLIYIKLKKVNDSEKNYWLGISMILLYMSIDEGVMIHEYWPILAGSLYDIENTIWSYWQTYAGILVSFMGLLYIKFWFKLKTKYKLLFLLSVLIFIGGAIGMEFVEAWWGNNHGGENMTYIYILAAEEALEMLGVSVFIYTALEFLKNETKDTKVTIT